MTVEDGNLIGSAQVITMDPSRAALVPENLTVWLPVTMMPSLDGTGDGTGGEGGLPGMGGLGAAGTGAQAVPGGIGKWGITSLLVHSVPVLAAGMLLTRTGP
ncbi:MAG: hypothetical protein QME81_03500 [bacterium]|nr:hypothetical protein [bacterium]